MHRIQSNNGAGGLIYRLITIDRPPIPIHELSEPGSTAVIRKRGNGMYLVTLEKDGLKYSRHVCVELSRARINTKTKSGTMTIMNERHVYRTQETSYRLIQYAELLEDGSTKKNHYPPAIAALSKRTQPAKESANE